MRKLPFAIIVCLLALFNLQALAQVYKDKNAPIEDRIQDLISRMTLEEKILQLNQTDFRIDIEVGDIDAKIKAIQPEIGSVLFFKMEPDIKNRIQKRAVEESRLGIPILFGSDVIHGFRTVYPIPLAQACSWNPQLVEKLSAMAAKEAKLTGVDWTFSPMIDVCRDPRWGRVAEGYGEDPYTNAVFAVASVKGYQGASLTDPYSIAACLKHYVGYGKSEGGRDYHFTDISRQSLWETYLVPYQAGVEAGAATLMSAFNDISGVPASANYYTLTEILKNRWKHEGFVLSDWAAIKQLVNQGVASDLKEAAYKAFMAGLEMDMVDNIYLENLGQLVNDKRIPIEKIDDAVRRILRVKYRLGLFEKPYTVESKESDRYLLPEYKALAAQIAAESMVLLKNSNNTLPLSKTGKRIALIGPLVKDDKNLMGTWTIYGKSEDVETVYDGITKEFSGVSKISYAKGCDFEGDDESGFKEAYSVAKSSDVIILLMGEKQSWSGENASRSSLSLPAIQENLVKHLKKTGKPIVLVLSNGRPLELVRLEPLADAIVEMWQPGIAGGSALAGILSGRINPSGKLAITFPLTVGHIPVYYNMRQSARPHELGYRDVPTEALYWFGHGLSYTTFSYGTPTLSSNTIKRTDKLTVEVEVRNGGTVGGTETVLWYISDPACTISRPKKELKYFEKQEIPAGETRKFRFVIDPARDLSYTDDDGKRFLENGEYFVIAGEQKIKFEVVD